MRVVVTGGGSGIGAAVIECAIARGWTAVPIDRSIEPYVDVGDERQVATGLDELCRDASIEGVVCAAGILREGAIEDATDEQWSEVLRTNLMGVVHVLRYLGSHWKHAGVAGSAVVVSSMAADRGMTSGVAYATSKAALNGLVRAVALDWAPLGCRINAVMPGSVDTAMLQQHINSKASGAEGRARLAALQPLGRIATPHEIAEVCCFLLSSQASYVTGASIPVDGALALGYG